MTTIYDFSLIAAGIDPFAADFEDRFFEAGCDDATIALQKGAVILAFLREASSLADAIASAIADVRRAGARVERIEPDPLVSLADIAKRSSLSRAAISNYASGERIGGFPAPVSRVTTESPLWEWESVAAWLFAQGRLSETAVADAKTLRRANDTLELARIERLRAA